MAQGQPWRPSKEMLDEIGTFLKRPYKSEEDIVAFFYRFLEGEWSLFVHNNDRFQQVFKERLLVLYFEENCEGLDKVWHALFDEPMPGLN